jgi:hypothetical protein
MFWKSVSGSRCIVGGMTTKALARRDRFAKIKRGSRVQCQSYVCLKIWNKWNLYLAKQKLISIKGDLQTSLRCFLTK